MFARLPNGWQGEITRVRREDGARGTGRDGDRQRVGDEGKIGREIT